MRLFSAQQIREVDEAAAQVGIPTLLLMENAGRAVAEAARQHWPGARRALLLCGKGNNGGDGYVAARFLQAAGVSVTVLELAAAQAELGSDEARAARAAWLAHGETRELNSYTLGHALAEAELVVDALFGSGLSRPLEGMLARSVERVSGSGVPILSVDVPSGLASDTAAPLGPHLRATRTLQLAGAKLASALYPAAEAFGAWDVADIGIPENLLDAASDILLLDGATVRPWLPRRKRDAHKYEAGTVLVVAGSSRYLGAAELACRGAYRAGAGLVTLAAEARLPGSWPEIIFEHLEWRRKPLETLRGIDAKRAQARVLGPGLDEAALPHLPKLIRRSKAPTVLDAGALEPGEDWAKAVKRQGRCVLTPHAGEAARLLGSSAEAVNRDPLASAGSLAEALNATVVLKGASTVVAAPDGRLAVSVAGHPGMATGGTGDVLSGMLGAFLAQADDLFSRSCAAVYLHGKAGERAARTRGDGLVASDLVEGFGQVWLELGQHAPC